MPKPTLAAAAASLVAAVLAAQEAQKPPDPVATVAEAEKLCQRGDIETAMLLLWEALDDLGRLPPHPVRGAAALTARMLLERHDPLAAARKAAFAAVAAAQVELATAYRLKRWFDTAGDRLDAAAGFDEAATGKEREILERTRPKTAPRTAAPAPAAAPPAKADPMFDRAQTIAITGSWQALDGGRLACAAHDGGELLSSWFTRATHEDGRFAIEFAPADAAKDYNATLAIGGLTPTTFVGVRVAAVIKDKVDVLDIYRLQDNDFKILAGVTLPHRAAKDGSQRLVVEVRGASVRAFLGDAAPLEAAADRPVHGTFGFGVGLRNEPSCAVEFRHFEQGPLPVDEPSDEELRAQRAAAIQTEVAAAVDAARAELGKKRFEEAAKRLREARSRAAGLAAGLLRDNLVKTIDELVDKADPLAPKRRKAAQDCADALVGLADAYAGKGMARAAFRVVGIAASFAPDGLPARSLQAQQAVDAWNVAEAEKRAAELQPPTDDGAVLREWFAKGHRLFTVGASWVLDGPALRVDGLGGDELSSFLPRYGMPPLQKAAVSMRLPAAGAYAGFCVDVAGPHDYALIELARQRDGLALQAFRFRDQKWTLLHTAKVRVDRWRLEGWFELALEVTDAGIVARSAGMELLFEQKLLGVGSGQFGLCAGNNSRQAITVELRAFRLGN